MKNRAGFHLIVAVLFLLIVSCKEEHGESALTEAEKVLTDFQGSHLVEVHHTCEGPMCHYDTTYMDTLEIVKEGADVKIFNQVLQLDSQKTTQDLIVFSYALYFHQMSLHLNIKTDSFFVFNKREELGGIMITRMRGRK